MKLGMIGLGKMGGNMTTRLLRGGHTVVVSDSGMGRWTVKEAVDLAVPVPVIALAPQRPSAYGRLLLDVLRGDPTLSIRDDEAEESWRIMAPILDAWAHARVPLLEYPAGSDGPHAPGPQPSISRRGHL